MKLTDRPLIRILRRPGVRLLRVGALLVALLGAILPATSVPAAAAGPSALVTCVGQQVIDYSPGLRLTQPRDVTYQANGSYSSCPLNDGVTSVTYTESGFVPGATCVAFPSTATANLHWSNGQNSTVQVTGVEIDVAGATSVYASLGTVTAGRYAGSTVNVTVEFIPDLLNPLPCLTTTGLTRVSGLSTLVIV
ncbi:hypothetical protein OG379_00085 [Streptomyces sp. NBC_01166]|uniref:hypothetical protein n=1 Tax=Streptomyces sp. NBC_01166 TaxID=2903755 RepID=UPI003864D7F2|nr:hypothetical protein OG379_00085 [Streptomyces sp. NBC_01166]